MTLSYDNIIAGDGIGIAITGMLIVFSGLFFISIYIYMLPKILSLLDKLPRPGEKQELNKISSVNGEKIASEIIPEVEDEDLLAAIALVIHMEMQNLGGNRQKITILRDEAQAPWFWAGKMRPLRAGR